MNLNELFEPQAKLDERIIKEHNLQGQDLIKKKTTALLTELFECVNEARFFKFWSKDQKARINQFCLSRLEWTNPLLEEYVDTLHFALSIANDISYNKHEYKDPGDYDLNDLTIGLTNLITLLPESKSHTQMSLVFNYLIKLGYQFGFNEKIVKEAYYKKNKINLVRQEDGY